MPGRGGVCLVWGVVWLGGSVPGGVVCLVLGGPLPGGAWSGEGGSAPGGWVCAWSGGVPGLGRGGLLPLPGPGGYPSMH